MIPPHRQNNFDLIRLLAAAQVVVAHSIGHTGLADRLTGWARLAFDALMLVPGVPIFFVISGFLIMKSFERNPSDVVGFFWRRGLRIFPALWVCLGVTLALLAAFGFLGIDFIASKTFAAWLAGQVSFFQFYNPEHFRGFGIGVANGALWTITVELQFYAFVPILFFLNRGRLARVLPAGLFVVSFALFCLMDHQVNGPGGFTGAPLPWKLLHVTLVPHLWMFLLGIHLHRHFGTLRRWIDGKFLWYAAGYAACVGLVWWLVPARSPGFYLAYLPARVLLALATVSGAYTWRSLSHRLLRGADISYGLYLYHSLVINAMVQLGMLATFPAVGTVFLTSIFLALISWHAVEKPALAGKAASPKTLWSRVTRRTPA